MSLDQQPSYQRHFNRLYAAAFPRFDVIPSRKPRAKAALILSICPVTLAVQSTIWLLGVNCCVPPLKTGFSHTLSLSGSQRGAGKSRRDSQDERQRLPAVSSCEQSVSLMLLSLSALCTRVNGWLAPSQHLSPVLAAS